METAQNLQDIDGSLPLAHNGSKELNRCTSDLQCKPETAGGSLP